MARIAAELREELEHVMEGQRQMLEERRQQDREGDVANGAA